jgi:N-acetylmannosamine-6-phosphate 2-epimerase/N-acetylmannosamine kinase
MKKPVPPIALQSKGRLIVSCQAAPGDAFRDPAWIARFAVAAVRGGAAGIRASGAADVQAIRRAVEAPIIGIEKSLHEDGRILITPSFEAARKLAEAGADMIALDCSGRGQRYGAFERLRRIKSELGLPVLADVATVEEAIAAAEAGADFVLSTLRGYTPETEHVKAFQPSLIAELARTVEIPVIAEGQIATPEHAAEALAAGAFAVVVGAAITRPEEITRRFVAALSGSRRGPAEHASCIGIDLGATNTKLGIVGWTGELTGESSVPTPALGREALLNHLKCVGERGLELARSRRIPLAGLGIATAGWVNPDNGRVVYATENLPGWTGAPIAETLEMELGLPTAVENDANAVAVAEKHFGLAKEAQDFVCITLGSGVGGGCYVGGRLNRGSHFFANGLGHICLEPEGLPCTCGQRGCLEVYANAAALVRYADDPALSTAEQVIQAANSCHQAARRAIRRYASYLAWGCASIIHLLDPEVIIFSGGLAQNNPALLADLAEELAARVTVWPERRLRLQVSPLGYYSGVLGAAAIAMEQCSQMR